MAYLFRGEPGIYIYLLATKTFSAWHDQDKTIYEIHMLIARWVYTHTHTHTHTHIDPKKRIALMYNVFLYIEQQQQQMS